MMTPQEEARACVEAWLNEPHMIDDTIPRKVSVDALVDRLVPVYEKAQAYDSIVALARIR